MVEDIEERRARAIMRSRRMYETDRISALLTAEDNGKIKGAFEERQKNVRHMYQEGFDVKTIAKALDLSEQDVNDLLSSNAG